MQGWIPFQTRRCQLIQKLLLLPKFGSGSNNVPLKISPESEQSELSEDEKCVLQVHLDNKREFVCKGSFDSFGRRSRLQTLT